MYTLIISLIIVCVVFFIIIIIKNRLNKKNVIEDKTINNNSNEEFSVYHSNNISPNEEKSIDSFTNTDNNIKMVIFVATWCGACNSYKNNIHNDLSKELKNIYKNIKFEFIVDDPDNENTKNLQKYFEIKYFPTIILYKNDKFKKLPMNDSITTENIKKLINEI